MVTLLLLLLLYSSPSACDLCDPSSLSCPGIHYSIHPDQPSPVFLIRDKPRRSRDMSDSSTRFSDSTASTTNHHNNNNNKSKSKNKKLLLRVFAFFFGRATENKTLKRLEELQEMGKEVVVVVKDVKEEMDDVVLMRRSIKQLHFGGREEKAVAAAEIKRMAMAEKGARRRMAELGVIPSLVEMVVESPEEGGRLLAMEALTELSNGNFTNKALMVEAGLLAKLPTCSKDPSIKQELALLLLSISSLAKTPFPLSSSHILPFITEILNTSSAPIADNLTMTCLATLYNLSTKLENTVAIVTSGAIHALLTLSMNKTVSQGVLATLGNLVPSTIGRKAIENDSLSPNAFIEIMTWDDKPSCQELAIQLVMVLAHRSVARRREMAEMGIVKVLLELALLGSPLAQKRALKIMQWFKADVQGKMGVHSGPQAGRGERIRSLGGEARECRRDVNRMVKQSLDMNMELIMRRANGAEDGCGLKSLAVCSSSKSLPY